MQNFMQEYVFTRKAGLLFMDIMFSEVKCVLSKKASCFSEVAKLIGSPMQWGRKKPHFPITNITSPPPFGEKHLNPSRVHVTSLIGCKKKFFVILGLG
jgi:hypothetical protein